MILSVRGFTPKIGPETFIAANASVIGQVSLGRRCSVWFNTVLRGDVEPLVIGDECNIQDGSIIHGTYHRCGTTLEQRVTVGHGVILHGCFIGNTSLVGMGSVIMDLARIGDHCVVGAGSLVTEEAEFEPGTLILGRPAKAVRKLTDKERKFLDQSADNYLEYKKWYEEENEKRR